MIAYHLVYLQYCNNIDYPKIFYMFNTWYIVELVFRIHNKQQTRIIRFDKQLRLIEAHTDRAYQKAIVLASEQIQLLNAPTLKYLEWEYIGMGAFHEIDTFEDGMEIHYSIEETENPIEYIKNLKYYNADLQEKISVPA